MEWAEWAKVRGGLRAKRGELPQAACKIGGGNDASRDLMARYFREQEREQLLWKLDELWRLAAALDEASSWGKGELRTKMSQDAFTAALEKGLRYALRGSARAWGLPEAGSDLDTALAVLFRCSDQKHPRRQALLGQLRAYFPTMAKLPAALGFERFVTAGEFSSVIGDERLDPSTIESYLTSRSLDAYPQVLEAAVSRDAALCHLFPRYASPSFPWARTHPSLVRSIVGAMKDRIAETPAEDLERWKSWLMRWLEARPDDVPMRDEPFEPLLNRLLSGDEIASVLIDAPARFLNLWNQSSKGFEKKILRDHFWLVIRWAIETLCADYDAIGGLLLLLKAGGTSRELRSKVSEAALTAWLSAWFRGRVLSKKTAENDLLADVAVELLPRDALTGLLAELDLDGLVRLIGLVKHEGFARRLAEDGLARIAEGSLEIWNRRRSAERERPRWPISTVISDVIKQFGSSILVHNELLLGYSLGVLASQNGLGVDQPDYWRSNRMSVIGISDIPSLPPEVLSQARLWYLLHRLGDYHKHSWDHRTEILGLNSELTAHASAHPDSWALALPWILERADLLNGLAESVTVLLAREFMCVSDALEAICSGLLPSAERDRAVGIRALGRGLEAPNKAMMRAVMDTITKWVDGAALFPHPLELPSATWLASLGTEGVIRSLVESAESEFRDFFRTSAGLDEDLHTSRLLAELERAMKNADLAVRGLAARPGKGPMAVVSHRQAPKKPDEARYGFDLALIVKGSVRDQFALEIAEFVQVKKLRRPGTGQKFGDDWSIDLVQLEKIQAASASAGYWLIDSAGKLLAVPAKLISAIAAGRNQRGSSLALSHHEMRSMAIPLSQFFVDLLVGAWIGNSDARALRIARGEDDLIRPRHIVEIEIRWHQE